MIEKEHSPADDQIEAASLERTHEHIPVDSLIVPVVSYFGHDCESLRGEIPDSETRLGQEVLITLLAEHSGLTDRQIGELVDTDHRRVKRVATRINLRANIDVKMESLLSELKEAALGEPLETTLATWEDLVLSHYGFSKDRMTTATDKRAVEARQALAYLYANNTVLSRPEIARRAGFKHLRSAHSAIDTVNKRADEDTDFAHLLQDLQERRLPEGVTQDELLERLADLYDVPRVDIIGQRRGYPYDRARRLGMHILARSRGYTYTESGKVFNRLPEPSSLIVQKVDKELPLNPRLLAERQYVLDPANNRRPPSKEDILVHLGRVAGVTTAELRQRPRSREARRIKRLAAFILHDELQQSMLVTADDLKTTPNTIEAYIKTTRLELAQNPHSFLEIDQLKPWNAISLSMVGRILRVVEGRFATNLGVLASSDDTPELNQARHMATALLRRAGYTQEFMDKLLKSTPVN